MAERLRPGMLRWPAVWVRSLAGALLPCSCALCGERANEVVCTHCRARYAAPRASRCKVCANPLDGADAGGPCGACLADPPPFDATVAACDYDAPLDGLVLGLKFGARLPLAPWFGTLLADAVLAQPGLGLPDVLCPVPLGPRRLVERGYNQALEIARPLARALGVDLQPRLLTRTVETVAQSSVAPRERARNIRGAFAPAPGMAHLLAGRHVGVVDDVMTSGHTLNEVAATLKAAGAVHVTNLVFARTPPH